jgi:hypothetical protein
MRNNTGQKGRQRTWVCCPTGSFSKGGNSLSANKTLDVVDGSIRVCGGLVLRRISDKTFIVGEGDIRGGDAVALIVGNNLNPPILVHAHAGVGGAQINTNDGAKALLWLFLFSLFLRNDSQKP